MEPYLGEIRIFAGNYAPQNWMICNGAQLRIADYQALYSLVGTTYGGDGVNNFNIPNLVGRLPIGQGTGPGLTARQIGQTGGADTVQLTSSATVGAHTHAFYASTDNASTPYAGPTTVFAKAQGTDVFYANDTSTASALSADVVMSKGSGNAHANQMPAQSINYIICVAGGIYPQRP